MTLEEYVLTYPDAEGKPLINIADYYERFVKPLSNKYSSSSFLSSRTVVCCFHDDINPSLGTINHKYLKGVRVYHCFGCGASGTVIRMHQRIQMQFYKKRLSDTEAALDLCRIYGLDTTNFEKKAYTGDQSSYMNRLERVMSLRETYTIREFTDDIKPVRRETYSDQMLDYDTIERRAGVVNKAIIKYVATKKGLI